MKKTIIAVSTLSCLLAYSAAYSQEFSNYDVIDNGKINGFYVEGFTHPLTARGSSASNVGLGLGYKSGLLRVEGQYEYGRRTYKYGLFKTKDTEHSHSFNLMGYVDLDNQTLFSPYVGLGIGTNNTYTNSGDFQSGVGVNPLVAVGTRAYFTKNLALDLGYTSNFSSLLKAKVYDNGFKLGLAYQF